MRAERHLLTPHELLSDISAMDPVKGQACGEVATERGPRQGFVWASILSLRPIGERLPSDGLNKNEQSGFQELAGVPTGQPFTPFDLRPCRSARRM